MTYLSTVEVQVQVVQWLSLFAHKRMTNVHSPHSTFENFLRHSPCHSQQVVFCHLRLDSVPEVLRGISIPTSRMLEDLLHNSDGFRVVDSLLGINSRQAPASPQTPNSKSNSEPHHQKLFYSFELSQPTQKPLLDPFDEMSLTRQLFNEFRPLFRIFDDAAFRPLSIAPRHHPRHRRDFDDPFESFFGGSALTGLGARSANVHLTEEGSNYVLEAELPGVKKENLDVSVGDNGRSITIEGRTMTESSATNSQPAEPRESNEVVQNADGTTSASASSESE